jgi:ammonium transporter Rh
MDKCKVKGLYIILGLALVCIFFSNFAFAQEIPSIDPLAEQLYQYHRGQDIFFMLMLVAFLMLFIKRYEWGVALATLLVLAGSFPVYMGLLQIVFGESWTIVTVIRGVVMAITLVIAIGMCLGHIKTWQFIPVAILFAPAYLLNEWFMFNYLQGVLDAGGSILVHMFAAYWGFGTIIALQNKKVLEASMPTTVHSVSFVWLASMLLWVLWPSFTTALLPPSEVIPGMVTTYMALIGSTLSAYLVLLTIRGKIDPLVYTYAILAGGVSIGSTVNLVGPWPAFGIGVVAGIISSLSFLYLHDYLKNKLKVLDTMGVHNLHGVGGIFGGLLGAYFAGPVQIIAIIGCIIIGLVTGLITGLIIRIMGRPEIVLDDAESFPLELNRTEPF